MVCVSVPVATAAASAATAAGTASTLATIGTYASLASAVVGGLGAIQQGRASSASAKYNAAVALNNQNIAEQNATREGQEGEAAVAQQQQKTRAEVGQLEANIGANGLENSGSAASVLNSATQIGQLNALTIRSNATKQAYGYKNAALSYGAEAGLDKSTAKNDSTAGFIGGGSTILSGAGNAALTYGKFLSDNSTL